MAQIVKVIDEINYELLSRYSIKHIQEVLKSFGLIVKYRKNTIGDRAGWDGRMKEGRGVWARPWRGVMLPPSGAAIAMRCV